MGCGWVGGVKKIMPRCGSILQAGTCQILSLAEYPRWSRVWQWDLLKQDPWEDELLCSTEFWNKWNDAWDQSTRMTSITWHWKWGAILTFLNNAETAQAWPDLLPSIPISRYNTGSQSAKGTTGSYDHISYVTIKDHMGQWKEISFNWAELIKAAFIWWKIFFYLRLSSIFHWKVSSIRDCFKSK